MRHRRWRFFAILFILWAYTGYKAAQLNPLHAAWAAALTLPFFAFMIGWQFIYHAHPEAIDKLWFHALAWGGSLTLGVWTTFVLFSLPFDFAHAAVAASGSKWGALRWHELPWAILAISIGIAIAGYFVVLRGPRVKKVRVPIEGLPKELRGLRIAQISDLHIGPTIRKKYVESVVNKINALDADVIALTGDLADGEPKFLAPHLAPLARLKAKSRIFYIVGNHEYYWGAQDWIAKARELGWTALINEHSVVEHNGARLLVAGVTDPMAEQFVPEHRLEVSRFAQTLPANCGAKILLAHRPETCEETEKLGFDLQLSGHTHAGQFFPFSVLIRFAHRHVRGLSRHAKTWIYVNPGTGYWGPANRFGVAPEITLLELENAHSLPTSK